MRKTYITRLECCVCGAPFDISRLEASGREPGHIKHMWCWKCLAIRPFVEIGRDGLRQPQETIQCHCGRSTPLYGKKQKTRQYEARMRGWTLHNDTWTCPTCQPSLAQRRDPV